jgi:hypothetical protein
MTTPSHPEPTRSAFQELLEEVRQSETLLEQLQNDDEPAEALPSDDWDEGPHTPGTAISDAAIDLIITFEVSSPAVYERKYRRPIWPRGRSGITIGIGYDVGYAVKGVLVRDWSR